MYGASVRFSALRKRAVSTSKELIRAWISSEARRVPFEFLPHVAHVALLSIVGKVTMTRYVRVTMACVVKQFFVPRRFSRAWDFWRAFFRTTHYTSPLPFPTARSTFSLPLFSSNNKWSNRKCARTRTRGGRCGIREPRGERAGILASVPLLEKEHETTLNTVSPVYLYISYVAYEYMRTRAINPV